MSFPHPAQHGCPCPCSPRRRYARDLPLRPRRLPDTLWGWVVPCLTYPEEDVIDEAGLDAAMYLRILKFGEAPQGGACPLALEGHPVCGVFRRHPMDPAPCSTSHASMPR